MKLTLMLLFLYFFPGPMINEGKLIGELYKLLSLQKSSPHLYPACRDLVLLAFREPKPLFSQGDKTKAAELVKESLPLLEFSFANLRRSLNPDLRQVAQRCRSGLQFLVDEFREYPVYQEITPILNSSPVKSVEEYIENTKGIPPEYSTLVPQDLTEIPASHFWWIEDDD